MVDRYIFTLHTTSRQWKETSFECIEARHKEGRTLFWLGWQEGTTKYGSLQEKAANSEILRVEVISTWKATL